MLSSLAASALALVVLVSLPEAQSGAAPLRGGHGSPARVVYVADELADEVFELFSVPTDGSAAPLRLNAPMPTGGDVGEILQVSGGRVLYVADALTNGVQELFIVADDGSTAPRRLSPPLPAFGDVSQFIAGPDFALFLADSIVDGRGELYRVPLDGSTPPVVLAPVEAEPGAQVPAHGASSSPPTVRERSTRTRSRPVRPTASSSRCGRTAALRPS